MSKPNIVILGAGYGGMITTVKLQKSLLAEEANITLINKHDYHYQSTWLHENAAGTTHHDRTRIPIQDIIHREKVQFIQDTVCAIDPEEKKVKLSDGEVSYDILVIGLGFEAATFGIEGLAEHSFTINSINSARLIREHIEYNFALYNNEQRKKQARLNIVVGGGGLTGVEFLGELANRVPELCREYDIDKAMVRIINIEGASTILPNFESQLVEYAINSLEARGIELITDASIKECQKDHVIYEKDGIEMEVPTMTTVWAAGVQANEIVQQSGFQTTNGKVKVRKDMRTPEYDDVFVVGDCALVMDEQTNRPVPATAQIAVQEASLVAQNIKALVKGRELQKFEPNLKGTVASLGEDDAVGVVFNNRKLYGWKAMIMKQLIENRYLYMLGGFKLMLKKGKFNLFV
ncbi:NAD(P)/FAD-dependent oxidoreductase [Virgibacillus sp. W0430]|uniref:NAD(P)/FAD-dependent oxidoreductase n=1 Tax=Virgibacillus sp. W0430 TaxID=3391580 RepID=UPI003F462A83